MYLFIYIFIFIYAYIYLSIFKYIYSCTYLYTCISIFVSIHIYLYLYMYLLICMYMYLLYMYLYQKGVRKSILLLFSHLRFCSSMLWLRQSLTPDMFPKSLNEKDFVVPGPGSGESLLCNEARRNLTDQQETAQWVGGNMVPKQLLTALFSHLILRLSQPPTAINNFIF